MPPRVTLKVTEGKLTGREFKFDECAICIIGRNPGCEIRLPDDEHHRRISRHHCLLDVNPPEVRVRDFGSLNGTYVNGRRIGRRHKDEDLSAAAEKIFPEYDLKDGDEIRLGQTVFRVAVYSPAICMDCRREIPEKGREAARIGDNRYRCQACGKKAAAQPPAAKPKGGMVCTICGKDVSGEAVGPGPYACRDCQADPLKAVQFLLMKANQGSEELPAIAGYNIIRELGRGGMGAVYLARHQLKGDEVALKVMLPKVALDQRAQEIFLREARVTKALKHPNVVQLLDSGCSEGTFFFTLEYCDGGSVDQYMLKQGKPLPWEEAVYITFMVLDGLEYAHTRTISSKTKDGRIIQKKGLVHRDLKPANIFLSGQGAARLAKIADLGLAKAFRSSGLSGLTATGSAAGSPSFMPRQQVLNFKYSKPEVDVWGAAASLYFMLTGAFPRNFPENRDPWLVVLQDPVIPIEMRLPTLPPALAEVINQALAEQPALYFGSAAEFKKALEKAVK